MVLILTRAEILSVLKIDDTIEVVQRAHAALASQSAVQPERANVQIPGSPSLMIPMVAATGPKAAGVKLLMDTPSNLARNLPTQQSTIVLVNPETGRCEAFLDGGGITLLRTAAASAVATRHLARSGPAVLGLIGAGAQARAHLAAIQCVREVDHVLVWSRTTATAARFADESAAGGVRVSVAASPEEVVRHADILCTLTPSQMPIVRGEWFPAGLHINAVGAPPRRDHREIDTLGIVRSHVVVDSYDTAIEESGDVMIPVSEGAITLDHFRVELGEVINGTRPGRRDDTEITLYNSVGVGIQDIATARLAVDLAREAGLGTEIALNGRPPEKS